MFGHQDNQGGDSSGDNTQPSSDFPSTNLALSDDQPSGQPAIIDTTTAPSLDSQDTHSADSSNSGYLNSEAPSGLASSAPETPDSSPAVSSPSTPSTTLDPSTTNQLLDVKHQALQELAPLVPHLDQPPEEKFRTLMMMIQAADDQSLVQSAYQAAHSITDDKTRAQALLDVVNEINYFTQHEAE